jgi:ElaB/YqjD/DUF883 family membrane-anchored ribosome-binding protein
MDKQLTQYLNEVKAELQELYEDLDSELHSTNNESLIDDSYRDVTSKLESALNDMDNLINAIDGGLYDTFDGTLEVDE